MPNAKCNDPFLNEHTDSLNPNGRVRRAEFKGWLWCCDLVGGRWLLQLSHLSTGPGIHWNYAKWRFGIALFWCLLSAFSVLWTFAKCIESWCLFLIRILKKWEIGGMVLCYKECLLAHLPYIETPPRVRIFQWKASPTSCHENACGRDAASWKSKLSSRVWGNTRTRCHGYLWVFWLDLTRGGQTLRRYFWLKVTSKRCHSCMMFEIQVWSII